MCTSDRRSLERYPMPSSLGVQHRIGIEAVGDGRHRSAKSASEVIGDRLRDRADRISVLGHQALEPAVERAEPGMRPLGPLGLERPAVAKIGDPRRAEGLERQADQMCGRRRRGRDHAVKSLPSGQADGACERERDPPRELKVGHRPRGDRTRRRGHGRVRIALERRQSRPAPIQGADEQVAGPDRARRAGDRAGARHHRCEHGDAVTRSSQVLGQAGRATRRRHRRGGRHVSDEQDRSSPWHERIVTTALRTSRRCQRPPTTPT